MNENNSITLNMHLGNWRRNESALTIRNWSERETLGSEICTLYIQRCTLKHKNNQVVPSVCVDSVCNTLPHIQRLTSRCVCLGQKSIHPYHPGSSNVLSWLYTNSLTVMLFGGNPVLYIIAFFFFSIDLRCQINPSLQSKLIMNALSCSCHEVARGVLRKDLFSKPHLVWYPIYFCPPQVQWDILDALLAEIELDPWLQCSMNE